MQLVRLLRAGEPVKMSKRAGEFVTLHEVVDEVGRDAVRFDMLYRKNDAALDFDLAKVIEHSRDNPVFYVQYGHARGQSVFRNAREELPDLPQAAPARAAMLKGAPLERLTDTGEVSLLRRIALYPRIIEAAAAAHEPHRIAFYLYELASEFHAHWTWRKRLASFTLHAPKTKDRNDESPARLGGGKFDCTCLGSRLARGQRAGRDALGSSADLHLACIARES